MLKLKSVDHGVRGIWRRWYTAQTGTTVLHNKGERIFTIEVEGHQPAFLKYKQISSDSLDLWTTVVPRSLEGKGIAKLLANEAFAFAREEDLQVKLSCWYLAGYLKRHPQPDLKIIE
jgi:predicted GNAT family acetyltransferase